MNAQSTIRNPKSRALRVLIVEDSEDDALLTLRELNRGGYEPVSERVDTPEAMRDALQKQEWDVVICDYSMPQFDGLAALKLLQETAIDLPFILVSGTVGERVAVEAMKSGAHDYLMKDNLTRLGPAIERELGEAQVRLERKRAEEALRQRTYDLGERVKELNCLYDVSKLVAMTRISVEEMLQGVADRISTAWQYAEVTCSRIVVDGQEFRTKDFRETSWRQTSDIVVRGARAGSVEVYYQEEKPQSDEGPFLKEERSLIDAIGEELGRAIGRRRVADELAEERRNLERTVQSRTRELRDTIRKLRDTNLRLEEANQHRSRFLSSMSHELRTPLNAILGFSDLLRGQFFGSLNEKQLEYVGQTEISSKHLLSLINDLLDVAKVDAGEMKVELTELSPSEFIDATVAMMSTQFRKKQLRVGTSIDPAATSVTGDMRKCRQIVLNLLSNAVKYTPEGGSIQIRAEKEEGVVRVEVSDTGIGIQHEDQEKIFSEFYQADRVRDEQLGGTGIGLALSRRLVELQGGEIGVRSQPGEGSTFWFTVPLEAETRKGAAVEKQTPEAAVIGRRILVAEDDDVITSMVLDMLSIHEHAVAVARNGEEAVELAQSHKPELILMDIRMPVVDGLEATRRLRSMREFADIPIIALTSFVGSEAETRSLEAGCTTYLSKPIRLKELLDVVQSYLGRAAGSSNNEMHPKSQKRGGSS